MVIKKVSIRLLLAGVLLASSMVTACSCGDTTGTAEKPITNIFASGDCRVTVSPRTTVSPGDTVDFKVHIQAGDWEAHIREIALIPDSIVEHAWPRKTLFEQDVNWPEWVYRGGATDDKEVSVTIPQDVGGQIGILLSIRYEFAVAEYDPDYYPPSHYVVDYERELVLIPLNLPSPVSREEPRIGFGDAVELTPQTKLTVENMVKADTHAFLFTRLEYEYGQPYVYYWLVDDAGRLASRIDGPNSYIIYNITGLSPELDLYAYSQDKLVRVYLGAESTVDPFAIQKHFFVRHSAYGSYTTTLDLNLEYTTPLSHNLALLDPNGNPALNAVGEPARPISKQNEDSSGTNEVYFSLGEESWKSVTPGKSFALEVREQYSGCLVATELIKNTGGQITLKDVEFSWWYDLVDSTYKLQEVRIHTNNSGSFPIAIGLAYTKIDVPDDEDYHPWLSLVPPYIMPGDDILIARTLGWWLPSSEKELTIALFAGQWDAHEIPYRGHYDPYENINQENYELATYRGSLVKPTTTPPPATEHGPAFSATAPTTAIALKGAWPTFGHDLQRTGQSPYKGPERPALKWKTDLLKGGYTPSIAGFANIAADGTVYFSNPWGLSAVTPDGTLKWKYEVSGGSALTISPDNVLYCTSTLAEDLAVHAVDSSGNFIFRMPVADLPVLAPGLGADGTIYISSWDGYLHAFAPDGKLRWRFAAGDRIISVPVVAGDGTIYFTSSDQNLYALKPDGSFAWGYSPQYGSIQSKIGVAPSGIIYTLGTKRGDWILYALNQDGTLEWESDTIASGEQITSLAISSDGTAYLGSFTGKLYAIGPDGRFKWSFTTKGRKVCSPAIDANGTVYMGSDGDDNLYALNPDGSLRWRLALEGGVGECLAIGSDGTIYTGSGQAISDR